ncbi:hypothetical protein PInf_013728 [Phytophthora infestans]|nr:hypothetical protein PInf_013728 [Phytophthora infestans]
MDGGAAYPIRGCGVDADPNLMEGGANMCTGLNSDEATEVQEEPEEEEDTENEPWNGDWVLSDLSDEEDEMVHGEFPGSIWTSIAKDKDLMKEMRHSGWEYGKV